MLEIFTHKSIYSDKLRLTLGSITLCSSLHWSLSTPRSAHRDVAKQSALVPAPRAPIYNIMATPAPSRTSDPPPQPQPRLSQNFSIIITSDK